MSGFDFLGDLIGGGMGLIGTNQTNQTNREIAAQNVAYQREFAQSGIQWRVADAMRAGIHPLAALGANTTSFSPNTIGATDASEHMSKMGQGVGRALKAAMGAEDRAEHDEAQARKLKNENMGLENDILRARLNSEKSLQTGQIGPRMPSGGPSGSIGDTWNSLYGHLSRSPERHQGYPVSDDKLKTAPTYGNEAGGFSVFGIPLKTHAGTSDAQFYENRYGEEHPITKAAGWATGAADAYESFVKPGAGWVASNLRGGDRRRYRRRGPYRTY